LGSGRRRIKTLGRRNSLCRLGVWGVVGCDPHGQIFCERDHMDVDVLLMYK
jgi:hypothetical protein